MSALDRPTLLALAALLTSLAALGIASRERSVSARPAAPAEPASGLAGLVVALEHRHHDLLRRIEALESSPRSHDETQRRPATSTEVAPTDFAALHDQMHGTLDSRAPAGRAEATEFRDRVAAAIAELEHLEMVEKRFASHRAERSAIEVTMPMLVRDLGLSPEQAGPFALALQAQVDRREEITRRWRDGAPDEELSDLHRWEKLEFEVDLASVLTPAQAELYRGNPIRRGGSYVGRAR